LVSRAWELHRRHAARWSQCQTAVPQDHRVRRARQHVGARGVAAHVRVAAVRSQRAGGGTAIREMVFRHQIVPAPTRGAEIMDQIFG